MPTAGAPAAGLGEQALPPSVPPSDLASEPAARLSELEAMVQGSQPETSKASRSPAPPCSTRFNRRSGWATVLAQVGGCGGGACRTGPDPALPVARSDPRLPGQQPLRLTPDRHRPISNRGLVANRALGRPRDLTAGAGQCCAQELLRRSRPLEDQYGEGNQPGLRWPVSAGG